jgi:hypothetical protein
VIQGQDAAADITLAPLGSVSGTVFEVNNVPAVRVPVIVRTSAGDYQGTTDATGNFFFPEVQVGPAHLESYDPATQGGAAANITVAAGQNTNQNLTFVQGVGTVTGTVTDSGGSPISGAQIQATTTAGVLTTTTAADGTYTLPGVPIGVVTIAASTSKANGSNQGFVDLPGGIVTINVTVINTGGSGVAGLRPGPSEIAPSTGVGHGNHN